MLVVKDPPTHAGDVKVTGSISGLGRCPWVGNGNPLQYLCLENPSHGQRSLEGHSPYDHTHTHTQKTQLKRLRMQHGSQLKNCFVFLKSIIELIWSYPVEKNHSFLINGFRTTFLKWNLFLKYKIPIYNNLYSKLIPLCQNRLNDLAHKINKMQWCLYL